MKRWNSIPIIAKEWLMSKVYRFDQFKHMDIFLKEVGYFLSVANTGNISKAAETLGVQQSGLSRAIIRLEESLGHQLFERKNNGLHLTAAGMKFLTAVQNTKLQWEQNFQDILQDAATLSGVIKIGCNSSYASHYLPQMIAAISRKYPAVEMEVHSMTSFQIIRKVSSHDLDFGVVAAQVKQPDLVCRMIGEDYIATYQYAKDLSAGENPQAKKVKFLLFNPESQMSSALLRKMSKQKKIAINDYDILAQSIVTEEQIGLLPDSVAKRYPHLLQTGGALIRNKISLVTRKENLGAASMKELWSVLIQSVQTN